MRLGVKHQNQHSVIRADFSGGLNTAASIEGIAENQLSQVINMELDHSTGRLKTCAGTVDVFTHEISAVMYDGINKRLLLADNQRRVYVADLTEGTVSGSIGTLTGTLYPSTDSWEDGLLIATGGKLQYYNGAALVTIESPNARSVYIRAGHVVITDNENVRYSGVGDETNWTEDTGDPSAAVFVEAGYKDGGKFVGMASLSEACLLIKDNRRVYRLVGEFPEWQITEISRNVDCLGRMAFCSVADAVFILGKNTVAVLQVTDNYRDSPPQNVATLITSEIQKLPANALVRYVPPLSQVWFVGADGGVLIYDLAGQAWYARKFNSPVVDVFAVGEKVYVAKADRLSRLEDTTFYDAGKPLMWRFRAQRLVSKHDYLLKRTEVSIIPFTANLYSGHVYCGAVMLGLPMSIRAVKIYHNRSPIWKNRIKIHGAGRTKGVYAAGERIYKNMEMIYGSKIPIFSRRTISKFSTNVFRSKFLDMGGYGTMGGFVLNHILIDIAEV